MTKSPCTYFDLYNFALTRACQTLSDLLPQRKARTRASLSVTAAARSPNHLLTRPLLWWCVAFCTVQRAPFCHFIPYSLRMRVGQNQTTLPCIASLLWRRALCARGLPFQGSTSNQQVRQRLTIGLRATREKWFNW